MDTNWLNNVKWLETIEENSFNYKIAIVRSLFNESIVNGLLKGALDYLLKYQTLLKSNQITIINVPGAFEIPHVVAKLIEKTDYDGILTLGAVIKGETAHFEYISNSVINSLALLNAKSSIPIALGVLTTLTDEQAVERSSGKNNSGYHVMKALHDMLMINAKIASNNIGSIDINSLKL